MNPISEKSIVFIPRIYVRNWNFVIKWVCFDVLIYTAWLMIITISLWNRKKKQNRPPANVLMKFVELIC